MTLANLWISKIRQWMALAIFWYTALAIYLAVLLFLSLNPWILPTSTDSMLSPDKLDHAVAYGGLVNIFYFCLTRSNIKLNHNTSLTWFISFAVAALTGTMIEIAQSKFTSNRTGSIEDAFANAVGAAIGLILFKVVKYFLAKKALGNQTLHY